MSKLVLNRFGGRDCALFSCRKRVQHSNKLDPIGHKLGENQMKEFLFALLLCSVIISLHGCNTGEEYNTKVAIENFDVSIALPALEKLTNQSLLQKVASEAANDVVRGAAVRKLTDQAFLAKIALGGQYSDAQIAAVEKLTDQNLLAKIAFEGKYSNVREAAIKRLTDQAILAEIAFELKYYDVGEAAIKRLTDQAFLAKIALEGENSAVQIAAVEKLTDPAILAKIALEVQYSDVPKAAIKMLTSPAMLAKITVEKEDRRVQAILKLISALDSVPPEHHSRLIANLFPAIRILTSNECVIFIGSIVSVKTSWSSESCDYYISPGIWHKVSERIGETFGCSIKLYGDTKPLSHSWTTKFPEFTNKDNHDFCPAGVNSGDLLRSVFKRLPQSLLAKIGVEDQDSHLRKVAVMNLTNQILLKSISNTDGDVDVRKAAEKRLQYLKKK